MPPIRASTTLRRAGVKLVQCIDHILNRRDHAIYGKFSTFTMIGRYRYVQNLSLAQKVKTVPGAIVECGVWRGGMIAGLAASLGPNRSYVLFDSFEGLPEVSEADGPAAAAWQSNTSSPGYHDNCAAEMAEALSAMKLAGIDKPEVYPGWFNATLPSFVEESRRPIALLRLDGDWYDSTLICLEQLFPMVESGGVVIIDDYDQWDGCNRAVHRYLADADRPEAIRRTSAGVAYLVKS
jgi:O-methyltransferase